ncbi:universal stress protein [Planctomycetaceae bacterium SH139]
MSFDPHESDVNRQVDASMKMFERAKVGKVAAIVPAKIRSVLLCRDGSTQDQAVVDVGTFFAAQDPAATILWLDAREHDGEQQLDAISGDEKRQSKWQAVSSSLTDAYDKILDVVAQHQPDLVVVPCPFGRDFSSVGADSAGTVIDVLLKRCSRPMLVIRRVDQAFESTVDNVVMVVGSENESEPQAAEWMLGLVQLGDPQAASVTLNLVLGDEQIENIKQLMSVLVPETEVDREKLEQALAAAHARLDAALRHAAGEQGFRYQLIPRVDATEPRKLDLDLLVVLPLEKDDDFGQGFVQSQIRHSPHPLLIVPNR